MLRRFPKEATDVAERIRTDGRRLFQREGAQERIALQELFQLEKQSDTSVVYTKPPATSKPTMIL